MSTLTQTIVCLWMLAFSVSSWADPVWIDVRSAAEYQQDHIEGDILIPHSDIVAKVQALYPDKSTDIHLYCRSGGRAGKAKAALEAAGYTAVENAGGIGDARKYRQMPTLEVGTD